MSKQRAYLYAKHVCFCALNWQGSSQSRQIDTTQETLAGTHTHTCTHTQNGPHRFQLWCVLCHPRCLATRKHFHTRTGTLSHMCTRTQVGHTDYVSTLVNLAPQETQETQIHSHAHARVRARRWATPITSARWLTLRLDRARTTQLVLWCQVQIVSHFVVLSTFCLRCYS